MAQAVPNLCVSRKVFLKHQVNSNTVCCAIRELPWRNIWLSDIPVEVLNEHFSLLVGRYVQPRSSVCVTRINLGLMINAGMLFASSRAHLRWIHPYMVYPDTPLHGALRVKYVPERVTRGAFVVHRYIYEHPRFCIS